MKTNIRRLVVLGAGTMGAQVAAHAVGQGLEVALLDLASPAPERSALARRAIEALRKLRPSPFHLPEDAALVRPGNFEDDWSCLADPDWVFEAVVEDLDVKRRLFDRVAATVKRYLPSDGRWSTTLTGTSQQQQESFASLLFALVLAVVVIYMILRGRQGDPGGNKTIGCHAFPEYRYDLHSHRHHRGRLIIRLPVV